MFERKWTADEDLDDELIQKMIRMKGLEWPERYNEETFEADVTGFRGKRGFCEGRSFIHIFEGSKLVGQSESFPRTIFAEGKALEVLTLAGVVCHPDYRGLGLGRQLIEPVFQRVDSGEFSVCLFQTPIPDFYQHFGCALVEDTFFNGHLSSRREATIWWEEYVMIYPGNRTWFEGPIDLNGPAY